MLALMRKELLARTERPAEVLLHADSEHLLLGSETELHSIFQNLISNAVKYTPVEGRIEIRWWVDRAGGHVSVKDTGLGIPAEQARGSRRGSTALIRVVRASWADQASGSPSSSTPCNGTAHTSRLQARKARAACSPVIFPSPVTAAPTTRRAPVRPYCNHAKPAAAKLAS
jgi:two-component sensor histidine kinase